MTKRGRPRKPHNADSPAVRARKKFIKSIKRSKKLSDNIKLPHTAIIQEGQKESLTNREILLLDQLLTDPGRNKKDIALAAGYSETTSELEVNRALAKPNFQRALSEVLKRANYDEKMQQKYDELLELDVKDFGMVILKALDQLHKLRGDYSPTKHQTASLKLTLPGKKPEN